MQHNPAYILAMPVSTAVALLQEQHQAGQGVSGLEHAGQVPLAGTSKPRADGFMGE